MHIIDGEPGDCFVSAWSAFVAPESFFKSRGYPRHFRDRDVGTQELCLVHGLVWNQRIEGWMTHAWIESWNVVYDFSNNRELVFIKSDYYKHVNPESCVRYTRTEMILKSAESGSYGPWDIEPTPEEIAALKAEGRL